MYSSRLSAEETHTNENRNIIFTNSMFFVGDSLAINNGMKFSTKDQDHDSDSGSCAKRFHAAWWFRAYYYANPNGMYQKTAVKSTQSVNWYHFGNEHRALKTIRFMIRLK